MPISTSMPISGPMPISKAVLTLATLGLSATLVACGDAGSSNPGAAASPGATSAAPAASAASTAPASSSGASTAAGGNCRPATSQQIVLLEDDKQLQNAENIVPAVNADAATQPLLDALNKVQGALTQERLLELNRAVQVERTTSANAAKKFVEDNGLTTGGSGGSGKIVVGAANFAESETLANVYAQALRAAGFDASVKTIGNRELYLPALQKGEVQVIPEYLATLTTFLNTKKNGRNAEPKASPDVQTTLRALTELGNEADLVFGQPAEAYDANAFAVNAAFAEQNGLRTLSDLAKCNGGQLVLGGPPECTERPFCRPGLESKYGLKFTNFTPLDAGGPLTKTAIQQGRVQLGLVFSSDPSLVQR